MSAPRAARTWPDLTDHVAMAAIRARLLGVPTIMSGLLSLLGRNSLPPGVVDRSGPAPFIATLGLLVLGPAILLAGRRLGDRLFLAALLSTQFLAMFIFLAIKRQGLPAEHSLMLVVPTATAAVFCGRRLHVWIQACWAAAIAGLLTTQGTAQDVRTALPLFAAMLFTYGTTSFVIRVLRDIAVASVVAARRGELTDPLTGLHNRRGMEREGTAVWRARARERRPVAVLVVDIDHFKRVNDTLGHSAGDQVLCRVADLVRGCLRTGDVLVRLGGEEFAVLAALVDGADAPALAERIRGAVESGSLGVTVSVGLAELVPDRADQLPAAIWQAVSTADHAMYQAKRSGRNRVAVSLPS